jgi:hypothetical protein
MPVKTLSFCIGGEDSQNEQLEKTGMIPTASLCSTLLRRNHFDNITLLIKPQPSELLMKKNKAEIETRMTLIK